MGIAPTGVSAQVLSNLPAPGQMLWLSPGFHPPILRGMTVHLDNPLQFDFIVDRGQDMIKNDLLKEESTKLIKYFLTAMTIPDKDAWVNLSPYEADRIIPDALGQTEMGRQMLEQDYVLKQLSASLTNPDKELGEKFWNEVKARAQKQFGTTEIPLNTFNKVWIVPNGATVVEKDGFAYITESQLKVMLEEDYIAMSELRQTPSLSKRGQGGVVPDDVSKLSTQVFRELILPQLNKELNEGNNFAPTRQVYQSVILAAWYKKALKDSLLGRIYADKSKVEGVESDISDIKQKVYEQYLEAFKKGVYNIIKEDNDSEAIPRKYFSGGQAFSGIEVRVDRSSSAINEAAAEINRSAASDKIILVVAGAAETRNEQSLITSSYAAALDSFAERSAGLEENYGVSRSLSLADLENIDAFAGGPIYSNPVMQSKGIFVKVANEWISRADGYGWSRSIINEGTILAHLDNVAGVPKVLEYGNVSISSGWKLVSSQYFELNALTLNEPEVSSFRVAVPLITYDILVRDVSKLNTRYFNAEMIGIMWEHFKQFIHRKITAVPYLKLRGLSNARALNNLGEMRLSSFEKLQGVVALAGILDQIHAAGVIHNAITEFNVLVSKDQDGAAQFMIIDFSDSLFEGDQEYYDKWLPLKIGDHFSVSRRGSNAERLKPVFAAKRGESKAADIRDFAQMVMRVFSLNEVKRFSPWERELKQLLESLVVAGEYSPQSMAEVKTRLEIILGKLEQARPKEKAKDIALSAASSALTGNLMPLTPAENMEALKEESARLLLAITDLPDPRSNIKILQQYIERFVGELYGKVGNEAMNYDMRGVAAIGIPLASSFERIEDQVGSQAAQEVFLVVLLDAAEALSASSGLIVPPIPDFEMTPRFRTVVDNIMTQSKASGTEMELAPLREAVIAIIKDLALNVSDTQPVVLGLSGNSKDYIAGFESQLTLDLLAIIDKNPGSVDKLAVFGVKKNENQKQVIITYDLAETVFQALSASSSLEEIRSTMQQLKSRPIMPVTFPAEITALLEDSEALTKKLRVRYWHQGSWNEHDVTLSGYLTLAGNFFVDELVIVNIRPGEAELPSSTIVASSEVDQEVGGINFDPTLLDLQIKRDGRGVPLPLPQQDLENINIKGLYPVIINIQPISVQNLPILSQLSATPEATLSKG